MIGSRTRMSNEEIYIRNIDDAININDYVKKYINMYGDFNFVQHKMDDKRLFVCTFIDKEDNCFLVIMLTFVVDEVKDDKGTRKGLPF